jgi:hypothetical protein
MMPHATVPPVFLCGKLVGMEAAAVPRLVAQAQAAGTRFGVEVDYADHFNLGVGAFVKFHLADMNAWWSR